MKHVALALCLLLVALQPAVAEPTYRAFVTNENDGTLSVLDIRSGKVETTVPVGKRPRGIGFTPDHSQVYVALGEENVIAVVDTQTLQVVKKLPAGSDPESFAVHPNGYIYLSNEDANQASVLDPVAGKVVAEIPVGVEPEGVSISPDGKLAMVTSESTHMVHVVTIPDHKVIANILVGARPREVAFSTDGRWAYVTSEIGGQVSKLDVAANKVVQAVPVDVPNAKPKGVLLSRDQHTLYVSTGGGNAIAVVDADTLAPKAVIPVGKRVWGLALSRDGTRLYACNGLDGTVSVIDTTTQQVSATIQVGSRPWGLVIDD